MVTTWATIVIRASAPLLVFCSSGLAAEPLPSVPKGTPYSVAVSTAYTVPQDRFRAGGQQRRGVRPRVMFVVGLSMPVGNPVVMLTP
jgi:hypothetical protein